MRIPKVSVENFRGKLRIRFTLQGKTYNLSLGLDDTATNRRIADGKAGTIQADIASENFDPTLNKYRPKKIAHIEGKKKDATLLQLWDAYTEERSNDLSIGTIKCKFASTRSRIESFGKEVKNKEDAEKFKQYLLQFNKPNQVRTRFIDINAAYKWGIKQKLVSFNPFEDMVASIQIEDKKQADPFTKEEIEKIIDGFNYSPHNFYLDYVIFLFSTGVRTGEAIALKWKNVKPDFSEIWICESYTRGILGSTKTGKSRMLPCNQQLSDLLKKRYEKEVQKQKENIGDQLVFYSPDGKYIDAGNFLDRNWKIVLDEARILYRPQYNTRHTFISHMLAAGMEPLKIAKITGHDVKVLLSHYAGIISKIEIPNLI